MINNRRPSSSVTTQKGIVLVTSVMFLVVLTLLVLSMMRGSILEERMVANSRDWNNAFQAAESALRDAELELRNGTRVSGQTGFTSLCSDTSGAKGAGLCLPNLCTDTSATGNCTPIWTHLANVQNDAGWKSGTDTGKSVKYGTLTSASALAGLSAQPRYIIEVLTIPDGSLKPGNPPIYLYRISAVGFGINSNSRVMLQSVVRPR